MSNSIIDIKLPPPC